MRRSLVVGLILGVLVSAVVIALHVFRVTLPLEEWVMSLLAANQTATRVVSVKVQYALVVIFSITVAWMVTATSRRKGLGALLAILAGELVALSWICLLYKTFFQPLPSIFAVALGFVTANGYVAFLGRSRSRMARDLFGGRVSSEKLAAVASGELPYEPVAKNYEATAVVCDIANKHDLAEECPPEVLADITQKFGRHATESFLKAGAYIESVSGEGIVAVFGFPEGGAEQAEKATRHALSLLESFEKVGADGRDEAFTKFHVHLGISSGAMSFAPLEKDHRSELLATGEPVELARRFCIANRFYGSRVLIGPRTFELASSTIVARPIDFLSGVDVRERHEIYEPLVLAADATPEQIARRDSFWNGVVLYREKRWGEAYSEFQKARGPNDEDDPPLQLYVRRLEPLALHLVEASDQ
ncbi:MAG: adenylate/guanylate cyclase domain-containing protein [Chthoniobacterales bacterium]